MLRAGVQTVLLLVGVLLLGGWSWFLPIGNDLPGYNATWFGHGWERDAGVPAQSLRFPHRKHVVEEELACDDCHEGATESARAGLPEMELCADCHDEADDDAKDKAGCLLCHVFRAAAPDCTTDGCPEVSLPDIEVPVRTAYRNLRYASEDDSEGEDKVGGFSHAVHGEADVVCADCHGAIAEEGADPPPRGKWMPRPQRCFDCHAKDLGHFTHDAHARKEVECDACHDEEGFDDTVAAPGPDFRPAGRPTSTPALCADCHEPVASACSTCHVEGTFARDVRPADHGGGWSRLHGGVVALRQDGAHGSACTTCHVQSDCIACHQTETPRDHTNFWRERGHGLMVAGNRERCETCHRPDYCERCHNETAPRSHIGTWAARHCGWCHLDTGLSAGEEGCAVCHRAALHTSAPHPINAATQDCYACHDPVSGAAARMKRRR